MGEHSTQLRTESATLSPGPSTVVAPLEALPAAHVLRPHRISKLAALLRMARPLHWVKNSLVFAPLLLAHQFDRPSFVRAVIAFASLCGLASSAYILNDVLDLKDDRKHPTKRRRPLASGELGATWALCGGAALFVGGAAFAIALQSGRATGLLFFYWLCSVAYSLHLKRRFLVDVFLLAGLYTLRITIGGAATSTPISAWLLPFAMFLFLSLAFVKRYAELRQMRELDRDRVHGRGYVVDDLAIIESVGPASGYLAVLVLALYVNSEMARSLYRSPFILWLICPLMMYWITRVWFFARRGWLEVDPVVFAAKDRVSWYTAVLAALIWATANWKLL